MDSMRSLNSSLPGARRRQPTPQLDTHQSFRTAALTVTNLYKAALADIDRARIEGYQDAIEDILGFLEKENIGLTDGEGWRVRQWASERLSGSLPPNLSSDSDEEVQEEPRARSSSPVIEHQIQPQESTAEHVVEIPTERANPAPISNLVDPLTNEYHPPPVFNFTSGQSLPPAHANDMSTYDISAAARRAFPTRRPSNRSASRHLQRSALQNQLALGHGAGQKRKLMKDFFNIDLNDRRDGPGGGPKRGRMT